MVLWLNVSYLIDQPLSLGCVCLCYVNQHYLSPVSVNESTCVVRLTVCI